MDTTTILIAGEIEDTLKVSVNMPGAMVWNRPGDRIHQEPALIFLCNNVDYLLYGPVDDAKVTVVVTRPTLTGRNQCSILHNFMTCIHTIAYIGDVEQEFKRNNNLL